MGNAKLHLANLSNSIYRCNMSNIARNDSVMSSHLIVSFFRALLTLPLSATLSVVPLSLSLWAHTFNRITAKIHCDTFLLCLWLPLYESGRSWVWITHTHTGLQTSPSMVLFSLQRAIFAAEVPLAVQLTLLYCVHYHHWLCVVYRCLLLLLLCAPRIPN